MMLRTIETLTRIPLDSERALRNDKLHWLLRLERRWLGLRRFERAQDTRWGQSTIYKIMLDYIAGNGLVGKVFGERDMRSWMLVIFPQPLREGSPAHEQFFGLTVEEARAYWQHPVLRKRLAKAVGAVVHRVRRGENISFLGDLGAAEFYSCIKLFEKVDPERFREVRRHIYIASVAQQEVAAQRKWEAADRWQEGRK